MKMKRIAALAVCALLAAGVFAFGAAPVARAAAADMTDAVTGVTLKDADGDGLYELANANQLKAFRNLVNGGNTTIGGELTADIDLQGSATNLWTPIAVYGDPYKPYEGTFDGQGHTISNLYVEESGGEDDNNCAGLFAILGEGATIRFVTVSGGSVTGGMAGAIAARASGSDISIIGCGNEGVQINGGTAGGILGCCMSYSTITLKACWNTGAVVASSDAGGIAGYYGYGTNGSSMISCWNAGPVTAAEGFAGGIAGYTYRNDVRFCYSEGPVKRELKDGNIQTGGLIGYYNTNLPQKYIADCIFTSGTETLGRATYKDYHSASYGSELQRVNYSKNNILSTGEAAVFLNRGLTDCDYAFSQDLSAANSHPVAMRKTDPDFKTVYSGYEACKDTVTYTNDSTVVLKANKWHPEDKLSYEADGSAASISRKCSCGAVVETVTLNVPDGATYNGSAHAVSASKPTLNGQTVVLSGDIAATDAGSYTATMSVGGKSVSRNYTVKKANVTAADLELTLPDDLKYDGAAKQATVKPRAGITGMGQLTVKYFEDAAMTREVAPVNVGTYYVGVTAAEGANYNAAAAPVKLGSFSITPRLAVVTPAHLVKTFGEADPALDSYTVNVVLADGTAVTGALGREPGEDVGEYAYTLGSLSFGPNYTLELDPYAPKFEICKRTVTVTPDAGQGKVYGETDPDLTYTCTGLVGEDAVTGVLTREPGENAGAYAYSPDALAVSGNYDLQLADENKFVISKAVPVVTGVTAAIPADSTSAMDVVLSCESASVPGTLSLVDTSVTFAWGENGGVQAVFTPEDGVNYEPVPVAVTVTVTDTLAPTGTAALEADFWTKLLEDFLFRLVYNRPVEVTLTAEDGLSGVALTEYAAADHTADAAPYTLAQLEALTWQPYADTLTVTAQDAKTYVYYFRITDKAGNVAYLSTEDVAFDLAAPIPDKEGTFHTTAAVTFADANGVTLTLNGQPVEGSTVTLPGNVEATHTVVATDDLGNSAAYTFVTKLTSDLTADVADITAGSVSKGDKEALNEARQAVENALAEGGDAVTEAEQLLLQAELERIDKLLDIIAVLETPDTRDTGRLWLWLAMFAAAAAAAVALSLRRRKAVR